MGTGGMKKITALISLIAVTSALAAGCSSSPSAPSAGGGTGAGATFGSGCVGCSRSTTPAAVNTNSPSYQFGYNEGTQWAHIALEGDAIGGSTPMQAWCSNHTPHNTVVDTVQKATEWQDGCSAGWNFAVNH